VQRWTLKAIGEFDFVIINSDIDISVEHFVTIANSARLKFSKHDLEKLYTPLGKW